MESTLKVVRTNSKNQITMIRTRALDQNHMIKSIIKDQKETITKDQKIENQVAFSASG